jgi:hypothetical protein
MQKEKKRTTQGRLFSSTTSGKAGALTGKSRTEKPRFQDGKTGRRDRRPVLHCSVNRERQVVPHACVTRPASPGM